MRAESREASGAVGERRANRLTQGAWILDEGGG